MGHQHNTSTTSNVHNDQPRPLLILPSPVPPRQDGRGAVQKGAVCVCVGYRPQAYGDKAQPQLQPLSSFPSSSPCGVASQPHTITPESTATGGDGARAVEARQVVSA